MDIVQTFYNNMASQYDKLFSDWYAATQEQALIIRNLLEEYGYEQTVRVLDCACGIGTQAIGLALIGYSVTGSDISEQELQEARARADAHQVSINLKQADFCHLSEEFTEKFDVVICMDNALPHMLSHEALELAVLSITGQIVAGGIFIASIRDYDELLKDKPTHSAPYIHKTKNGQRVSLQTWDWDGEHYSFTQYIIEDDEKLEIHKFDCEYRCVTRAELTELLHKHGCRDVLWKFPEETGFYQPIVIARK